MDSRAAAPFYPPRVAPAARPLRFPFNLVKLLQQQSRAHPGGRPIGSRSSSRRGRRAWPSSPAPEAVKTLLLDRPAEFPKGGVQVEILAPIFGNAMISAEGEDWRWQRGVAAPLFRHDELLRYGPVDDGRGGDASSPSGAARRPARFTPIHTDMMRAAFDVISNTHARRRRAGRAPRHREGPRRLLRRGINWWVTYTLLGLPHWLPRPGGKGDARARDAAARRRRAIWCEARRAGATRRRPARHAWRAHPIPRPARRMSDENLVDNIVAFLMAGYDTTAFALTWTLYLISQSPRVGSAHARRRSSGSRATARSPPPTSRSLTDRQQVLNELLRLFPTAPIIVRDILEDIGVRRRPGPRRHDRHHPDLRHPSSPRALGAIRTASIRRRFSTTVGPSRRASSSCRSAPGRASASAPPSP